ncbi:MAG: alpha-galactosidase [bacterium]|jgi:alpha-galactosidase
MSTHPTFWRLDGASTTLIVVQDHVVPRIFWYGSSLGIDTNIRSLLAHDDAALPFGTQDEVTPLSLFPQASTAYAASAALSGHRQGAQFAHRFQFIDVQVGDNELTLLLRDRHTQLDVEIMVKLDAQSDVASMSTRLINTGNSPFTVDWLAAATLPLPNHYRQCLTQHGRWGLENQTHRREIAPGRIDISNLRGRTSHEHAPSLVLGSKGFCEDDGDVIFAHLAWSGNFSLRVEQQSTGEASLQCGVLYLPGECILEPGSDVTTPAVLFSRGRGMNQCTQRFHRYVRSHVLPAWTRQARPIHANSWEALYFNHDEEALYSLIDAAAGVGAERFVLDDGWFLYRRNDTAGLGDWFVDKTVYPNGLKPIVDHVRQHGMQFGLWFEPEMVNQDSDLFRAHPDWTLQVNHIDTPLARNQLVLDIARDDVSDYLFECITTLVHEYAIDYIKWDQNRDLVLAGDGDKARAALQPPALYQLLARILNACPALEIETCASGGARVDMAVLKHTGRVWTSDNIDPIERTSIQQGFLRFLPAEIMGAHVGHKTAHLTGRVTSLHTRAIVALQGQFGFELDARRLDPQDIITLQHYTMLYKSNRSWLANACYWQIPTHSDSLTASGNVDETQDRALFSIVATNNMRPSRPGHLPLRGLDPDGLYTVKLESINIADLAPFNKVIPGWCEQAVSTTGELLMKMGLPLPVLPPQSALLIGCYREQGQ